MADLPTLKRRRLLLAAGATVAIAGCTSDGDDAGEDDENGTETEAENGDENGEENGDENGEENGDENGEENGDENGDTPDPAGDDHDYEVKTYDGVDVPIVPLEDALEWYEQEATHFVDARGSEQSHENARIPGSVWSPNPDGTDDDPVDDWASDEPIVVYSGELDESSLCVIRASRLIGDGHEYVYVLEEGFGEWRSRNYPMEGLGPDGELEDDEGEDEDEGDDGENGDD